MKEPTCESQGYTTWICSKCFDSYVADYTDALGHDYDEGVITKEPLVAFEGEKTFTCRRCGLSYVEPVPALPGKIDMSNIDMTVPAADGRFVIDYPATAARSDETGLYLTSTTANFEATGTDFAPSDVIKIPVTGDEWTATMKFTNTIGSTFSWGGDSDLLGFYVMDNFQNGVGMRGGNNSIVNFSRKNGTVTTNNAANGAAASSNGLNTNDRVHWYRIAKSGDDYVCSYSPDGEEFTELFTFTDTGLEGKMLVIDAYRGGGFAFGGNNTYNIEYVNFDVPAGPEYVQVAEIEPGKTYVIVADGQYALNTAEAHFGNYNDGDQTLGSTPVTVADGKITSEVTEDMLWTINEAADVQAALDGRDQYFIYAQDGRQLLRRSGRTSTAPLSLGAMSASNPQYATFSFYKRGSNTRAIAPDTDYTMYVNSYRDTDYPFTMSGSEQGFNAPGVARANWTPETYGSAIRLYTLAGEEPEEPCTPWPERSPRSPRSLRFPSSIPRSPSGRTPSTASRSAPPTWSAV